MVSLTLAVSLPAEALRLLSISQNEAAGTLTSFELLSEVAVDFSIRHGIDVVFANEDEIRALFEDHTSDYPTLARRLAAATAAFAGAVVFAVVNEFAPGATEATLTLDLPSELRNRIVRVELEQQRTAASVALLDERWRRRPVGLVSGESLEKDQPLLSGLYYVERALQPL